MPVVRCPNCRTELDLDPDDIGHRVECPGCLTAFLAARPTPPAPPPPVGTAPSSPASPDTTAEAPPPLPAADQQPPPLPPPPPPSDRPAPPPQRGDSRPPSRRPTDPITLTCPACHGAVSVAPEDLGHKVECPMCQQVFRADDPDRPARGSSRRDADDEPSWRRSSRGSRRDRDRDDDDWDDRPRRRSRYRDEDPYESADPKAWVWKARRDLATPGAGLEVLGWLDVAFGLISVIIGILFGISDPSMISGGPNWMMFWLNLGPGISGVVLGAVKAMGGRQMKQAKNRPLSMAACVAGCVPLNVSCCMSWLTFPAYIVGIVFGIMGMTQLLNRNVRKAFEVNRPGGDVDAV